MASGEVALLTYDMEARGDDTLYGYLYRCIRDDIVAGRIASGVRLPPKRKLADHLGVSTITIEAAYRQLVAEGYVEARERSGYYVMRLRRDAGFDFAVQSLLSASSYGRVSSPAAVRPSMEPLSYAPGVAEGFAGQSATSFSEEFYDMTPEGQSFKEQADFVSPMASKAGAESVSLIADFTGATAASGIFPYGQWARTLRAVLADESEDSMVGASGPAGCLKLRRAIAHYLRGSRGMRVSPDQIVVGAGAQVLYGLIVQLLGRDSRYAIETPGYPRLAKIYRSNDVALEFLPMEKDGVSRRVLDESNANVLHLMPSHQFPTGRVYPVSQRYELLSWASERPDRWIVEDDFDCEFRLAGRPLPALQSIDAQGCVIYANTFTKSLGPAFRLGYMVLPPALARRYHDELGFYSNTVGTLDQLTLARFLESGEYERHVNRLRTHFRRVQDAALACLRKSLLVDGKSLRIEGADSGLHFVIVMEDDRSETELADLAREQGVALLPMELFNLANPTADENGPRRLVVNFSGVEVESVPQAVAALERAWM